VIGDLARGGPAIAASFLASLVEAVEALTIVLAVGTVRVWRPAGLGAIAGFALLVLIVVALGPLLDRLPLHFLQLAIGILLLLFGMRWLRNRSYVQQASSPYTTKLARSQSKQLNCASMRANMKRGSIGSLPSLASRPYFSKDLR
jgi:uncharacterized membrane protein